MLNKIIVHELVKEKSQPIQDNVIAEELLDSNDEVVQKLFSEIHEVYGKKYNNTQYGVFFEDERRGDVPDEIEAYLDRADRDDLSFIELTKRIMGTLYQTATGQGASSGGYVVFTDYTVDANVYFFVTMIKKTPGITINSGLRAEELMHLDLKKLHQGARVSASRITDYKNATEEARQELNYLNFIASGGRSGASGYFISALGCSSGSASLKATRSVINETRRLFQQEPQLNRFKNVVKNDLVEFLAKKVEDQESVSLTEIRHIIISNVPADFVAPNDATLEEYVDGFIERLNSEEFSVPYEFSANASAVKSFTHLKAETDGWKLTFDKALLGEDQDAAVQYNRRTGVLSLTDVPQPVKDKLEEAIDDNQSASEELGASEVAEKPVN